MDKNDNINASKKEIESREHQNSTLRQEVKFYIPEITKNCELPENIKIDLDTFLETLLKYLYGGCFLISCYLFYVSKFGHYTGRGNSRHYIPPDPSAFPDALWFMAGAFLFFIIALNTDNYYILNTKRKTIYYHFKCLFWKYIKPSLTNDKIFAIAVDCREKHQKSSKWWEYGICPVSNDGKFTELSDFKKDIENPNCLSELNHQAMIMAMAMQCKFAECPEKHSLQAAMNNNSLDLKYFVPPKEEPPPPARPKYDFLRLIFTAFLLITLVSVTLMGLMLLLCK